MKDCLKLIHFHIGSQITKIRRIKNALREASQFFVQLNKMGFNIEFVDTGGGMDVFMTVHALQVAKAPSTIPSRNMSTMWCRLSSMCRQTRVPSSQYRYRDGTQPDCPSLRAYLRSAGNGFPARNGRRLGTGRGCSRTGEGTV